MSIQVYADKWGIGIFDDDGHDSNEPGPIDLRLGDEESFQDFVRCLLAVGANKGWKGSERNDGNQGN